MDGGLASFGVAAGPGSPGFAPAMGWRYWRARLWRRLPLVLAVTVVAAGLAGLVAWKLPAVYASQTQITIAAPQIQDHMGSVTTPSMPALQQLQLFEQRLLTRANLLMIARKLNVFPSQGAMSADAIVAAMRKATRVASASGRDQATLMTIGFRARTPELAAGVVNEYLTLILQDDVAQRTARAQDGVDFFVQEVARAASAQDAQSAKILAFKQANAAALPENESYMRAQVEALGTQIGRLDQTAAGLQQERDRLAQVYAATGQVDGAAGPKTPEQRQLDGLQAKLRAARAIYSERNPQVKMLEAQYAALQKTVTAQAQAQAQAAASGAAAGRAVPANPAQALLDVQMTELKGRLASLAAERKGLAAQLASLDAGLARIPANALALQALQRDAAMLQEHYASSVRNLAAARQAARIAALSRGERISVIQEPAVPSDPVQPRRGLIAAAGLGGGLAGGLGLAAALELMDRRVRRGQDLVRGLGIAPLAVLPHVATRRERIGRQSRRALGLLAALAAAGLAGLWLAGPGAAVWLRLLALGQG